MDTEVLPLIDRGLAGLRWSCAVTVAIGRDNKQVVADLSPAVTQRLFSRLMDTGMMINRPFQGRITDPDAITIGGRPIPVAELYGEGPSLVALVNGRASRVDGASLERILAKRLEWLQSPAYTFDKTILVGWDDSVPVARQGILPMGRSSHTNPYAAARTPSTEPNF